MEDLLDDVLVLIFADSTQAFWPLPQLSRRLHAFYTRCKRRLWSTLIPGVDAIINSHADPEAAFQALVHAFFVDGSQFIYTQRLCEGNVTMEISNLVTLRMHDQGISRDGGLVFNRQIELVHDPRGFSSASLEWDLLRARQTDRCEAVERILQRQLLLPVFCQCPGAVMQVFDEKHRYGKRFRPALLLGLLDGVEEFEVQ